MSGRRATKFAERLSGESLPIGVPPPSADALITETEDPLPIGYHDRVDLATGSVAKDLRQPVAARIGEKQTAAPPVDVAELLAGEPGRGGVDDREHLLDVVDDQLVEQDLVYVLQRRAGRCAWPGRRHRG